MQLFYDGPSPPASIFEDFLQLPALTGSATTQSFLEFFAAGPQPALPRWVPSRARMTTLLTTCSVILESTPIGNYSDAMLHVMKNETLVCVGSAGLGGCADQAVDDVRSVD